MWYAEKYIKFNKRKTWCDFNFVFFVVLFFMTDGSDNTKFKNEINNDYKKKDNDVTFSGEISQGVFFGDVRYLFLIK